MNQLVNILRTVHSKDIIHGAFSSSNILIHPKTLQIKLVNFTFASCLKRETLNSTFSNPTGSLEQDLQYISPEQTGRMSRVIDYRTDFYSLGIVIYELLLGKVPFPLEDKLELVYSHITEVPIHPYTIIQKNHLNSSSSNSVQNDNDDDVYVFKVLSEIVMCLLSKSADDRYQSTFGLLSDIKRCFEVKQQRLVNSNMNIENQVEFKLKEHDVCSTFKVSQKLFGRFNEINQLLNIFHGVCRGEYTTMLVKVTGSSGIGKTALINDALKRPITAARAYFISGNIDRFSRNIPYAPLIQALKCLIMFLLTENSESVNEWKNKILEALSGKGAVISNVIPEVELIIGKQSPVPELPPTEHQHRFTSTFLNFINVFASAEHPLIMFLDNLHQADLPTLSIISKLLTTKKKYLLLLAAYRSNEAGPEHPLTIMLEELKQKPEYAPLINRVHIEALNEICVNELIADSLACSTSKSLPLAKVVFSKTQGNPFFVIHFLTSLHRDGLLKFNSGFGQWEWSVPDIQRQNVTDNVVEFMTQRIKQLPPETQYVLSLAACLGSSWHLKTLSVVYGKSMTETAKILWPALLSDLLSQCGTEYMWPNRTYDETEADNSTEYLNFKFSHDKIQQAAYETLESPDIIHLKIGKILLSEFYSQDSTTSTTSSLEQQLIHSNPNASLKFNTLSHFALCTELILKENDEEFKIKIVRLALRAARKAQVSTAYDTSCKFLVFAITLLQSCTDSQNETKSINKEDHWSKYYELSLDVFKSYAEYSYLKKDWSQSELLYTVLHEHARSNLDKISIYLIQIAQYEVQQRFPDIVQTSLYCLAYFGFTFPQNNEEELNSIFNTTKDTIYSEVLKNGIEFYLSKPITTDNTIITITKLFLGFWYACYSSGLIPLLSAVSAKVGLYIMNHDVCEASSTAFVFLSYLYSIKTFDFITSYKLGSLGIQLLTKFNNPYYVTKCYFVYACGTAVWIKPLNYTMEMLRQCFEISMDVGDWSYAACSANLYIGDSYFATCEGSLEAIYEKGLKYNQFLTENNKWMWCAAMCTVRPLKYLLGRFLKTGDEIASYKTLVFKDFQGHKVLEGLYYAGKAETLVWKFKFQNQVYVQKNEKIYEVAFDLRKFKNWMICFEKSIEVTPVFLAGNYRSVQGYCSGALGILLMFIWIDKNHDLIKGENEANNKEWREFIEERKAKWKGMVQESLVKLKYWKNNNEANFEHKYLIIKGFSIAVSSYLSQNETENNSPTQDQQEQQEQQKLRKRNNKKRKKNLINAMDKLERGILSAKKFHFLLWEALGTELMGRMWLLFSNSSYSELHLVSSFRLYQKLRAHAKVSNMKLEFPDFLQDTIAITPRSTLSTSRNSVFTSTEELISSSTKQYSPADVKKASTVSPSFSLQNGTTLQDGQNEIELQKSASDEEENNEASQIVDNLTLLQATQMIRGENTNNMNLPEFLKHVMILIIRNAGAHKGVLALKEEDDKYYVVANGTSENMKVDTIYSIPLSEFEDCPKSIINFVLRTQQTLVLNYLDEKNEAHTTDSQKRDKTEQESSRVLISTKDTLEQQNNNVELFRQDEYIINHKIKSVMCMTIQFRNQTKGVIFLENKLLNETFSKHRGHIISLLCTQIALSLETDKFSALLESERKARNLAEQLTLAKTQLAEFVDVLCHELRNPLNGVHGNQQILNTAFANLEKSLLPNPPQPNSDLKSLNVNQEFNEIKEAMEGLTAASNYLKDIVDTVLTMSMIENGKLTIQETEYKVIDVLKSVVAMFSLAARQKQVSLVIDYKFDSKFLTQLHEISELNESEKRIISNENPEDWMVWGDMNRFKQVLLNVISNALKFTSKGSITVGATLVQICELKNNPRAKFSLAIEFYVKDTGIGISEEEQKNLFKKFSQANKNTWHKYGGSGLGLVIVKELVELLSGKLSLSSAIGEGTKFIFSFTFPLILKNHLPVQKCDKNGQVDIIEPKHSTNLNDTIANDNKKKRILIAEDNVINQKILRQLLQTTGKYEIKIANNGQEALDLWRNEEFECILMDMLMPIMGGMEATEKIRREEKEKGKEKGSGAIVIIGVSANAGSGSSANALEKGMNGYVTKPYHRAEILDVIQKFGL